MIEPETSSGEAEKGKDIIWQGARNKERNAVTSVGISGTSTKGEGSTMPKKDEGDRTEDGGENPSQGNHCALDCPRMANLHSDRQVLLIYLPSSFRSQPGGP
jgi:hypothetical protein